jgi:hypothetical protein
MPADDKMTMDERRKYLRQMQKRYRETDRSVREQLLDEMEQMIQLHRKSLIRLMRVLQNSSGVMSSGLDSAEVQGSVSKFNR